MFTSQNQLLRSYIFLLSLYLLALSTASAANHKEVMGAQLFRDKGCAHCHGDNAQGTRKGPSLQDVRSKLKTDQIRNQLENGGQRMPSFSDSMSKDEESLLVAFLRAKHRPPIPEKPSKESEETFEQ